MRIGIDIDGVLADVLATWVNEMNRYFKQEKERHDIIAYQFEKVYDVTWEEMDKFFRTNQEVLLSNLSPIDQAQEIIKELYSEHKIILITARPEEYKAITEKWLAEHYIQYDRIIFTNFEDKSKYCIEHNLDLFIEDSLENALSISEIGIPVILFDAPYNQADLPNLVERAFSWQEIRQIILSKLSI